MGSTEEDITGSVEDEEALLSPSCDDSTSRASDGARELCEKKPNGFMSSVSESAHFCRCRASDAESGCMVCAELEEFAKKSSSSSASNAAESDVSVIALADTPVRKILSGSFISSSYSNSSASPEGLISTG